MTENLKLIKEETIPLKAGKKSQDILLQDPADPEVIHLSFYLELVPDDTKTSARFSVEDPHQGTFSIKTHTRMLSRPTEMIKIGTYGQEEKPLFVTYELYAYGENSDANKVKVSFYTEEN